MFELKYLISTSLSEYQQESTFSDIKTAQKSIPEDQRSQKWNCIAKYKVNEGDDYRYSLVSYYDCVSPRGEITDDMQWYNYSDYKTDPVAKQKFNKTKLRR